MNIHLVNLASDISAFAGQAKRTVPLLQDLLTTD
jgi:hypothetical protein